MPAKKKSASKASARKAPAKKKATGSKSAAKKKASPAKKKAGAKKKAAPKKKATPKKKSPARKKAAAGSKAAGGAAGAPAKRAAKPKASGGIRSSQVNLGQVFALRPRVNTSFRPNDFVEAKRALGEEEFGSLADAARAVAEKALELTRGGAARPDFKRRS